MATYAVGDLQGHLTPLRHLLDRVQFDPAGDQLWLVGDLVNRGPESLAALRFVRELGPAAITVLGNHDLHLLAVALGGHPPRPKDTLDDILVADDRAELMQWLRQQPLLHYDAELEAVLVHAGVPFTLSLQQAQAAADEVQAVLRGPEHGQLLEQMYGNSPHWHPDLQGVERWRAIINYFTRMRFIDARGRLEMAAKAGPEDAPPGCFPWFKRLHPDFHSGRRIVFGHWAALEGRGTPDQCLALDTGCCWGGCMTLQRLEDGARFHYDCS